MPADAAPATRDQRTATLRRLWLTDAPVGAMLDRLTTLVASALDAPMCFVSLLDGETQTFISEVGFGDPCTTPAEGALCRFTVAAGEPLLLPDVRDDWRGVASPAAHELDIRAYAGVPLRSADGIALGAFCVGHPEPRDWGPHVVEALQAAAGAATDMLELRAAAMHHQAASARMEAERQAESRRLQEGLLPPAPAVDVADVATHYRAGSQRLLLGGDFVDLLQAGDAVRFIIGDVCGHGPEAAALAAGMRAAWAAVQDRDDPPEAVAARLNAIALREHPDAQMYVTALLGAWRPATGELVTVAAGHPWPLAFGPGGVRELEQDARPGLGMVAEATYVATRTTLAPEEGLLLYTDGIVEGYASPAGTARFGFERLAAALRTAAERGTGGERLLSGLVDTATLANGGRLPDDTALLLLQPRRD